MKRASAGVTLALIDSPAVLWSVLTGLGSTGVLGYGNSSDLSPLALLVVVIGLLSLLAPLALTMFVNRRVRGRSFLGFISIEVLVYLTWLPLMTLRGASYPPALYLTWWLPPTLSALAGYVLIRRQTLRPSPIDASMTTPSISSGLSWLPSEGFWARLAALSLLVCALAPLSPVLFGQSNLGTAILWFGIVLLSCSATIWGISHVWSRKRSSRSG